MGEAARTGPRLPLWTLLGPAFVASLAYVDPGNVAANLTAGARYGYALVWVLVVSNLMAMLLQYQSAKLGIVTGQTLPQHVATALHGRRHGRLWSWLYGGQAFVMAIATDLAEVVGGALGLQLLFGLPLWIGGMVMGVASIVLLWLLRIRGEGGFEAAITAVLAVIMAGFLGSLVWARPDASAAATGLFPTLPDTASIPLAAAMLGATVMPHAIYLHSGLAIDRHRPDGAPTRPIRRLLQAQRLDVLIALALAGSVNIAMLLLAAATLAGDPSDSIRATHAQLLETFGPLAGIVFGVGLLASGIGSAVVGTHAGSRIVRDLTPRPISPTVRRLATVGPAVLLLLAGLQPTSVLVASQVVLSFGIAFAAIPLIRLTGRRAVMGEWVDPGWLKAISALVAVAIVVLNLSVLVALLRP